MQVNVLYLDFINIEWKAYIYFFMLFLYCIGSLQTVLINGELIFLFQMLFWSL